MIVVTQRHVERACRATTRPPTVAREDAHPRTPTGVIASSKSTCSCRLASSLTHHSSPSSILTPDIIFSRTLVVMSLKRKAADAATSDAKKPKANGSITAFFGPPKTASGTASNGAAAIKPTAKFDKDAWVAKLTDEQKELLKLEIDTLHESWLLHLKEEITSPEFLNLKRFLKKEKEAGKKIFPPEQDIYSW